MAREYATQMEAARKGIITEELRGKGRYLCEQKS